MCTLSFMKSKRIVLILLAAEIALASLVFSQESGKTGFLWHDPAKIVKAEECGVCHTREYKLWDTTAHARGKNVDRGYENAEGIKERMGVVSLRHESLCIRCHSTGVKDDGGEFIAISGVSCESCHGAGRDWINVHNKKGLPPAEKAERNKKAKEAGMLRPSEIYDVVANCYQCHTVPHEELVNKGGHPAGSTNFDFLSRLAQIRHNFLEAQFDATKTDNRPDTPERLRKLYVVSAALELEFNIRGAAMATENGGYFKAMQRRVRGAVGKLNAIVSRTSIPEIKEMLGVVGKVDIAPNKKDELLNASNSIRTSAKKIAASYDGTQFSALDGMINGTDDATAAPAVAEVSAGQATTGEASIRQAETQQPPTSQAPSGTAPAQASTKSSYPIKTSLRPKSQFKVIADCNCHKAENEWMSTNFHSQSAAPFINKKQKVLQIAAKYGLKASEITKGNKLCMDCHGTIIGGQESYDVFDGVGCESCHGAGSGFQKPHSVKGAGGYPVGKDLGMLVLTNAKVRAEVCASCHYVTDPRLLSAGHPSGKDFDLGKKNGKIVHWRTSRDPSAGELSSAYASVRSARGGIPDVQLVVASAATSPSSSTSAQGETREVVVGPPPPRPAPVGSRVIPSQPKDISLSEFPSITDSTAVEKVLLLLKQRLDEIYRQVEK